MSRDELLRFLRRHRLAVEASVAPGSAPQAAVVGFAVSDRFEFVFDTLDTTRKVANLRGNPRLALVVGWDEERTAQIEGLADEPRGDDLARLKRIYFQQYPDGPAREAWPGITYVRVKATWIRYSDYNPSPPEIVEFDAKALGR